MQGEPGRLVGDHGLVPTPGVAVAGVLFAVTFEIDLAAYHHQLTPPPVVPDRGGADAGRQVLIAIAAAVITVIGVVFLITILALTLASQQFGPPMMRNFIRDIQVTLGVFVGTGQGRGSGPGQGQGRTRR